MNHGEGNGSRDRGGDRGDHGENGSRWRPLAGVLCAFLAGCGAEEPDTGGAEPAVEPREPALAPPSGDPITSVALRARESSDGPRFRRLDPNVTGLRFANELRKENVVPFVYSGAGLTAGDYDGDGLIDLYLVSQDGPNRLFRQVQPMRFEDATAAANAADTGVGLDGGDAWGTAAAFADVDGDGDLDLYVCNTESPNLLFENDGSGRFVERGAALGLDVVAASTGAGFADYDNDGDLDVYVLTNRVFGPSVVPEIAAETTLPASMVASREQLMPPYPRFGRKNGRTVVPEGYEDFFFTYEDRVFVAAQADRLLRNDGGRFRDVSAEAGIAGHDSGLSVTWWDADNDGHLDLYVANDLASPDRFYRNRGNGTFAEVASEALPHVAFFGMGSDFGDIDNDGRFDFWVADMSSTTHYMSKMLMGSMDEWRWLLIHSDPQQCMRNALFVNEGATESGDLRFLEAGHLAGLSSTDWTWSVRFADLDEDGRLDAYASNGIPAFGDNPDIVNEFKRLYATDREAALELARNMPTVRERNIARRNLGDLKFADVGAEWGLADEAVSHGVLIVDLDGDGDLDIVTNNLNQPAGLYENTTADTRRVTLEFEGRESNRRGVGVRVSLTAGGIEQARLVVLSRGYMSSGAAVEHFGLGSAARIDRLEVTWPSGVVQVFEGLDVDRHYTVREAGGPVGEAAAAGRASVAWFEPAQDVAHAHREREFDDFEVQPLLPRALSRLGPGMAWGDVDGDGVDEVWVGGAAGQAGSLWRIAAEGDPLVEVPGPWRSDAEREDMGAVFFDADLDGDLDLFVVSGGVEAGEFGLLLRDRLYLNDGRGGFAKAPAGALPELERSGSCVAAGDADGDGDLDLFVGSRVEPGRFPLAPGSVLLRNDGGRFVDATEAMAPGLARAGMVTSACWDDLNGDGRADLAVAAQWQPVRVWLGDGPRLRDATEALGLAGHRGQWMSLCATDLDGDGRSDLVALNLGLNTKYKADADHLLRIYADDYDGNQVLDIVEAKVSGEVVLPVRGRSCSSAAMPFLAERFPTYDAFARANLAEIYGEEALAQSVELVVSHLEHTVFLGTDSGFVPRPLPRRAQVAPGYGAALADWDGDGHLDLVFAQNTFSPEPETGRHDGGLGAVLRGRGDGAFEPVLSADSGLLLRGDAQSLAPCDLDGDGRLDLLCAFNDGPVRWVRGAAGGRPQLAVRLQGPAGNPAGLGAWVELAHEDRRVWRRPVAASAGYLTQPPPTAWFPAVESTAGWTVRVRWPDGALQRLPLAASSGRIVLARDS